MLQRCKTQHRLTSIPTSKMEVQYSCIFTAMLTLGNGTIWPEPARWSYLVHSRFPVLSTMVFVMPYNKSYIDQACQAKRNVMHAQRHFILLCMHYCTKQYANGTATLHVALFTHCIPMCRDVFATLANCPLQLSSELTKRVS